MPIRSQELIREPRQTILEVGLEPAANALGSLHLLVEIEWLSGLDDWVVRTAAEMSEAQRRNNRLALIGFFYAVVPSQSWPSFPDYIDHLQSLDAHRLQARLMDRYASLPLLPGAEAGIDADGWAWALGAADDYLAFLGTRFKQDNIDTALETEAHRLVTHPDEMKALLVSHFRDMWTSYLEP